MKSAPRALLRRLQPRSARGGIRILCYHLVGADTGSPVDLPLAEFRDHIQVLAAEAHVLALEEIPNLLPERGTQYVAITFDDAFRNFATHVLPVAQEMSVPVSLFVPTDFVAGRAGSPLGGVDLPPLEWRDLLEVATATSVTIGSHTKTHQDLRQLSSQEVTEELRDSRAELEDRLGQRVSSFCYPRALWNEQVDSVVRRHYDLAVIGGGAVMVPGRVDGYRLERTSVRSDIGFDIREWLRSGTWLEERVADWVRRHRRR